MLRVVAFRVVQALLLTSLLAPTPGASASSSEQLPSSFTPRTQIAYTPLQVWDWPVVQRLGVRPGAIYLIGTLDPYGRILSLRDPYEARHATLSPAGDRIAFLGAAGPSPARRGDGLYVVDTSGVQQAFFGGAKDYAWSPSGATLAIRYSLSDSAITTRRGGIELWTRPGRPSDWVPVWVDEMAWTSNSRILVGRGGVERREVILDGVPGPGGSVPAAGLPVQIRPARVAGVNSSPDGRYSILGYTPRVFDERNQEDVTPCVMAPAWSAPWLATQKPSWAAPDLVRAEWVRLPGAGHLLCATWTIPGRSVKYPVAYRTSVIDAETGEVVAEYSGMQIGLSADQHAVVRLVPEDVIELGDLAAGTAVYRASERPHRTLPPQAVLRVESYVNQSLGRLRESRRRGFRVVPVRVGDMVPSLAPTGRCDQEFRIAEVPGSSRVLIRYDGRLWKRVRSGGHKIPDDPSERAQAIVMNEGLTLVPRIAGEPYEVRLRTVTSP